MTSDNKMHRQLIDAAGKTADPSRAERNLSRFIEQNPNYTLLPHNLLILAGLFSISQFLANYCIAKPDELTDAIDEIEKSITREILKERAVTEIDSGDAPDLDSVMKSLRLFKKRHLLRITLRDITDKTDIQTSMNELTLLAETIVSAALDASLMFNYRKFGKPADSNIALIALGKLGGEELNYSSDIDLITVYDSDEGQTFGAPNPSGIMYNRISNHEFYCKVVELFNKILSSQTEDGIVYRVDLRLRPQGQKGDITLPLKAYKNYYESWGRTWERMVLIRARFISGDKKLGNEFIQSIDPFVWKKTIDFTEVEEIRGMKKKIDSTFTRDDIKRGYGGIREAEFFIQTFQLLYGGTNRTLKTNRMPDAVRALKSMNIVPEKELAVLWRNYLFFRRIEHYLQMKEDLQTHTLPSTDEDLAILARNMGFESSDEFLSNLNLRRMQIKNMYNSLLGTQEDAHTEALNLLEGKLTDRELSGYLSFRNVNDTDRCLANIKSIRERIAEFRTMQERKVTREVMPLLLESTLTAESPDRALAGLEKLLNTYGLKSAHLLALKEQKELMAGIIKIFSLSPYLTRIFLSNQQYLNMLIEEWSILKSLKEVEQRLGRAVERSGDPGKTLAEFRRFEEVRLGILFLLDILKVEDLFRGMSHLAEAIIHAILVKFETKGLSVIALGKLGGREMTFGSDLDIIFISKSDDAMTAAEKVIKALTAYTDAGQLYSVDTRLRPDGSKGALVKDIEGYRNYYLNSARKWEIQALLKARPVGGSDRLGRSFITMAKEVILQRGSEITKEDIAVMRAIIIRELAHERDGIDIKLGPGGVEEIEFYIQYMQLINAKRYADILVQHTPSAINRLAKRGVLPDSTKNTLKRALEYLRKLQTFLRLNEEEVIIKESDITEMAAKFMHHKEKEEFLTHLIKTRESVLAVI